MDSLNHAINLAEQTHAELTLLAAQRYDALNGSPAEVAKRCAVNLEAIHAALAQTRFSVGSAVRHAEKLSRSLGVGDKVKTGPARDMLIGVGVGQCEQASPPPHVRPNEATNGAVHTKMREQHPETKEGINPNSMFG